MTYIFLVAGKGSRLHPLTLSHPKSLYRLDENETVLERMIRLIKKNDETARIIVVTGFQKELIEKQIKEVEFVNNPFYSVTNSIASLWFAKNYISDDNITIINGDIVMSEELVKNILCKEIQNPLVLLDSSIKLDGDYNVQVNKNEVLVMSKELKDYYGEYAGVTKLNKDAIELLMKEIEFMILEGYFDQWYENALVQMIFKRNFRLTYLDICDYEWTEVDDVSDLIYAKRIHDSHKI